jgi:hypothetical protein
VTDHSISSKRLDPLRKSYSAGEKWELCSDVVSWCSIVAFSIYIYFHITENDFQVAAKLVFVGFSAFAIACLYYFRLAFQPGLDRERRLLLLSDSFGVGYIPLRQSGYYTSAFPPGTARLMFNLLENTFFYPRLLRKDAIPSVVFVIMATIGLVVGLRYGTAEVVELLALLLLFGEFGLGRILRISWMIKEFDGLHADCLRWFREGGLVRRAPDTEPLRLLAEYECVKSRGGVRAKDKTFDGMNTELSIEWERRSKVILADALAQLNAV